ncbi:MAG: PstS family phosphate ABC transporter substrate-binding protein [Rhodanobacteraceae bacterium]
MFRRSASWLLASLWLVSVSCAAVAATPQDASSPTAGIEGVAVPTLTVRGDYVSTEGLLEAVAPAFVKTHDVRLVVEPFNSIDGIDQALSGKVDMAAVARPADPGLPQESALTFVPVAWDALVLITNASNPVSNISLAQLHAIYYSKIKNWSRIGGLNQPINLFAVASPTDGPQFSFRRLLLGNGTSPVEVPRLFINLDSLQSEVSLDGNALALSTLSHAVGQNGIKIVSVDGVAPSLTTLENGLYPLPAKIYLAYSADSPKAAAIDQLLAFLAGPTGAAVLRAHDFLPYVQATALDATTEVERIDAVGARMMAEGLPPSYSPGAEFARLAAQSPDLARQMQLSKIAAQEAVRENARAGAAIAQQASATPSAPNLQPASAATAAVAKTVAPPAAPAGSAAVTGTAAAPAAPTAPTTMVGPTAARMAAAAPSLVGVAAPAAPVAAVGTAASVAGPAAPVAATGHAAAPARSGRDRDGFPGAAGCVSSGVQDRCGSAGGSRGGTHHPGRNPDHVDGTADCGRRCTRIHGVRTCNAGLGDPCGHRLQGSEGRHAGVDRAQVFGERGGPAQVERRAR